MVARKPSPSFLRKVTILITLSPVNGMFPSVSRFCVRMFVNICVLTNSLLISLKVPPYYVIFFSHVMSTHVQWRRL